MKTKQTAYLADVEALKWMHRHLKPQEKSRFTREAVAAKIAQTKVKKPVIKKR